MRTIDLQIADVIEGRMTAEQIAREGVNSYAIEFYSAQRGEAGALRQIRDAVEAMATPAPAEPIPAPRTRMCACGHESAHAMNTPSGLACPLCYDRMSE